MKRADKQKLGLTNAPTASVVLTPAQQLVLDYQAAFSTEAGERVLKDLIQQFQKRRSFVPDSNATAFHEGQRDVVRMIENFLDADALTTMASPEPEENS